MIIILSPAKTLDYTVENPADFSAPTFLNESKGGCSPGLGGRRAPIPDL